MSPLATPHSLSRLPVGDTQKSPSVLLRSQLFVYCVVIEARRQSNSGAVRCAASIAWIWAALVGLLFWRARLTLKRTFIVLCREPASETTWMMLPNSGFGRTPLTGAFRFSTRRSDVPRLCAQVDRKR